MRHLKVTLIMLNIICLKTMETSSRQCLQRLLKPCMNLFAGEPGGNLFRRRIDESVNIKRNNDIRSIILEALEEVDQVAVDKIY